MIFFTFERNLRHFNGDGVSPRINENVANYRRDEIKKSFSNRWASEFKYIDFPNDLIKTIVDANNITLLGHLMPDADCIGSCFRHP